MFEIVVKLHDNTVWCRWENEDSSIGGIRVLWKGKDLYHSLCPSLRKLIEDFEDESVSAFGFYQNVDGKNKKEPLLLTA